MARIVVLMAENRGLIVSMVRHWNQMKERTTETWWLGLRKWKYGYAILLEKGCIRAKHLK